VEYHSHAPAKLDTARYLHSGYITQIQFTQGNLTLAELLCSIARELMDYPGKTDSVLYFMRVWAVLRLTNRSAITLDFVFWVHSGIQ